MKETEASLVGHTGLGFKKYYNTDGGGGEPISDIWYYLPVALVGMSSRTVSPKSKQLNRLLSHDKRQSNFLFFTTMTASQSFLRQRNSTASKKKGEKPTELAAQKQQPDRDVVWGKTPGGDGTCQSSFNLLHYSC